MKNINFKFIFPILILLGCKKFVDIDPPQDRLVTERVFKSNETAVSALGGLYVSMMGTIQYAPPYHLALYTGLYSDEFEFKTTDIGRLALYRYSLQSNDAVTNVVWTNAYNLIYQANAIIEGISNSIIVNQALRNQLTGEAYFLRAFWHFYLLNLYGDIPLAISTNYSINKSSVRMPATKVYHQVESDLIEAKRLLTEKYVGATGLNEVPDRVRPNTYAATALLARVYLYQRKWQEAENEANAILLSSSTYQLETISNVFKKLSKEAIWQLQMPTGSSGAALRENTWEARYFIPIGPPTASNTGSTLSAGLLNSFQDSDQRKSWIGKFTTGGADYYYPFKYKSRVISNTIEEQSMCLRLAEIYLIRSEARAQQNNLLGSISDVDTIRSRAGISQIKNVAPNISGSDLLDSIFLERRRELFCEYGHRWFDIRRSVSSDDLMKYIASMKGVSWSPNWLNWPIPLSDIVNNNKLIQNEGYN